jgi:hypothetical protein
MAKVINNSKKNKNCYKFNLNLNTVYVVLA